MDSDAAARQVCVALGVPAPVLVRRGSATLYRAGAHAVRVEQDAAGLTDLSVQLRADAVPTPALLDGPREVGGLVVTVWEWVESTDEPDYVALGRLVARLGELDVSTYDVPPAARRVHDVLERRRPWPEALPPGLRTAIEDTYRTLEVAERATRAVLCHGDLHAGNVAWTSSGPLLLDWEFACRGPQWWDLVPIVGRGAVGLGTVPGDELLSGYGSDPRGSALFEPLVRTYLAALTIGMVSRARRDASAAAEAEQRLRWWDGDPSPWTAF